MKCDECGQRDAAPKRTKCWTCIKKAQRNKSKLSTTQSERALEPKIVKEKPHSKEPVKAGPLVTATDKLFHEWRPTGPDAFKFGDDLFMRDCNVCGNAFSTRITMLRQCSPKCMKDLLDHLSTMPKAAKV